MDAGNPPSLAAIPAASRKPGMLRRIAADPFAAVGITIYALFVLAAILAGWLARYDPTEILITDDGQLAAGLGPSAAHWLGTTSMGRDIFSQLILGVRPSLFVGVAAAVGVSSVGTAVGLLAGYFGGVASRRRWCSRTRSTP